MPATHVPNVTPAASPRSADVRTGCLLVLAVAALAAVLAVGSDSRSRAEALVAPELPVLDARCQADASEAGHRAAEAARAADAHMARYPFAPAAGLQALARLAEAEDCLALVPGTTARRDQLSRRAARHRARLTADYRDGVTRVRRAVEQSRLEPARDDVAYLLELLSGQHGPFVAELRGLQLELDATFATSATSEVSP
jgi:hypothetical protein